MTATAQAALLPIRGLRTAWRRFTRGLGDLMPKGLFARSLIIIIANLFVDIMYGILDPRTRDVR